MTEKQALLGQEGEVNPRYSSINPGGDNQDGDQDKIEIHSELRIKLYKRRWWILIIYSLFAGTQGGVWNTWGPISASSKEAFGWTNNDIFMLANWGPISYIVSAVFFSWMIDVKGLRWASLSSMFLVATGCGLRCITSTPPAVTWLVHTGQFLNGLGGPVVNAGPSALSSTWFPPGERITATAVGIILKSLGVGVSFLIAAVSLQCMILFSDFFIFHFSKDYRGEALPAMTMNIGQLVCGLGGPVAMGGLSALSSTWFPSNERTTSTGIAFCISLGGMSSSYLLGPLLVPDTVDRNCTGTNLTMSPVGDMMDFSVNGFQLFDSNNCSNASIQARITKERKDIMFLMYVEFGWCLLILLALLIYFPKKPPLPPCITASIKRESFWQGLKNLFTKGQFWLVCFVYGLAIGVLNCWVGVLDVDLQPHGISQNEAGWIGFYATCSGCVGSLIMARFADIFSKHMKWIILVMYTLGGGFFTWFCLICYGVAPFSIAVIYVTVIAGMTVLNSSVPLIYELGCELTYPIGEGTANGVLTLVNNIGGLVFLLLLLIPNIGAMWMNWALLASIGVCIPVLLLMKESYKRLELDESNPSNLQS